MTNRKPQAISHCLAYTLKYDNLSVIVGHGVYCAMLTELLPQWRAGRLRW